MACDASVLLERFTNSAREAVVQANAAAHEFQHQYVGSEHLLLGLIREGEGLAALVLTQQGVDLKALRAATLRALDQAA